MNIDAILKAAEYLERKEREAEHGYALTRPCHVDCIPRRRLSTSAARIVKTSGGVRSSHNELEKNRRAHLRNCLERLKDLVPLNRDATRHTTLGLLNDAKLLIKRLETVDLQQRQLMDELRFEHRHLRSCLDQITIGQYRVHSVSESSTVSTGSSSPSEHDEVDIIGSDVDDQGSMSSDSGISSSAMSLTPCFSRIL